MNVNFHGHGDGLPLTTVASMTVLKCKISAYQGKNINKEEKFFGQQRKSADLLGKRPVCG